MFTCAENNDNDNATINKQLVRQGLVTALDDTPMNYVWEMDVNHLNCTKPLYMSYLMNYVSVNINKPLPPILDIWKALDENIWKYILISTLFIIITDRVVNRRFYHNNKNKSFMRHISIFLKPCLGIGESLGFYNFIYILWIACISPLVAIIRNDLLVKMVDRDVMNADTIDDILDNRFEVYTFTYHHDICKSREFYKDFDQDFRQKFMKYCRNTKQLASMVDKVLALADNPANMVHFFDNIIFVLDELLMNVLVPYVPRFSPIHVGQPYLALLSTPLCYGPQFPFINETEIM